MCIRDRSVSGPAGAVPCKLQFLYFRIQRDIQFRRVFKVAVHLFESQHIRRYETGLIKFIVNKQFGKQLAPLDVYKRQI